MGEREWTVEDVVIPEKLDGIVVKSIDRDFFKVNGGRNIKSIKLPNTIDTIGRAAFIYCYELEKIQLPNSLTSIDWGAFWGCGKLTTVNYTGTKEEWEKITIDSQNDELKNATIVYNYTPSN